MHPLAPAPYAAPLPRRSEAGGGGGLVVLLLAERAPSEGPRSTRAIEDQPGHLLKNERTSSEGLLPVRCVAHGISLAVLSASRLMPHTS